MELFTEEQKAFIKKMIEDAIKEHDRQLVRRARMNGGRN